MPSYSSYMRQMSVLDNDDDIVSWITVKGNHIPIRKGQSKEDAVKSFIEAKSKGDGGKHYITTKKHGDTRYVNPKNYEIVKTKEGIKPFGSKVEAQSFAHKLNHTDPYAGTPFAVKNYVRKQFPYEVESEKNETKESNSVKREAAKIYSKLADKMGYVEKADLEKYLDDNEYFNDDVRKEIVKTVGELESQVSERHTDKDAPKPVHQWQQPRPRDKYVEGEVERLVKSKKKDK